MAAHCSGCVFTVCVFTAVCVHLGWVNCRAQTLSMGNHTWPHVTSLSKYLQNILQKSYGLLLWYFSDFFHIGAWQSKSKTEASMFLETSPFVFHRRNNVPLDQWFLIPFLTYHRSAYFACLSYLTHLIQITSSLEESSMHELCSDWHGPYIVFSLLPEQVYFTLEHLFTNLRYTMTCNVFTHRQNLLVKCEVWHNIPL